MIERPKKSRRQRRSQARVRIYELIVTKVAIDKLGARGISTKEAEQLTRNRHVTVRNPRDAPHRTERHILIGRTDADGVSHL